VNRIGTLRAQERVSRTRTRSWQAGFADEKQPQFQDRRVDDDVIRNARRSRNLAPRPGPVNAYSGSGRFHDDQRGNRRTRKAGADLCLAAGFAASKSMRRHLNHLDTNCIRSRGRKWL